VFGRVSQLSYPESFEVSSCFGIILNNMKKRVFIFGSGASVKAGFPLACDFISRIKKHLNDSLNSLDSDFKDEFNRFIVQAEKLAPLLLRDIELFFTFLDLLDQNIRIDLYNELFLEIDNLAVFRKKLSGALLGLFEKIHVDIYSKDDQTREVLMPYNSFCLGLSANFKDTVITFNYDLLLERELWMQNKWTFLDGYGIEKDIKNFEDKVNNQKYPENKPKQSKVKIYKLHGSVGWIKSYPSNADIYFEIEKNVFPGYTGRFFEKDDYLNTEAIAHDRGATLIEPSYLKIFENQRIKELWQKAESDIEECNELFVIGYSFPAADISAQQLIATAIRKSNVSKIVIVNPDHNVKERAEILLGRTVSFVPRKFEEWVKSDFMSGNKAA